WNWELGPFEQWDALGVEALVRRLEAEGRAVPPLARRALEAGGSFYRRERTALRVFQPDGSWRTREPEPGVLVLKELKAAGKTIRDFQNTLMAVKCCAKPVVAAVHNQALGGGCELALQSTRVQAFAETYIGLVELGVGLIPGGGGCKEMVIRSQEAIPPSDPAADRWSPLHRAFEMVGLAKTSTSAAEARAMGLLRDCDGIS